LTIYKFKCYDARGFYQENKKENKMLTNNYKPAQKSIYVKRDNAKITFNNDSKLSLELFISKFVYAIKNGKGKFLLDIDGTLSHFHSDKMKALVLSEITSFIDAMETKYPGSIILITGRSKENVERLFKLPNGEYLFKKKKKFLNVIAEHGAERWKQGERKSSVKLPQESKDILAQYKQKAQQLVKEIIGKLSKYIQKQESHFIKVDDLKILDNLIITLKNSPASGTIYEEKRTTFGFHTRILRENLLQQTNDQTQRKEITTIIDEFEQKTDELIGELQKTDPNLGFICKGNMHKEAGFPKIISKGKAIEQLFTSNKFKGISFVTLCDSVHTKGNDKPLVEFANQDDKNTHDVFQVGDRTPAEGLKFTGKLPNPDTVAHLFSLFAKKLGLNISKVQWLQNSFFQPSQNNRPKTTVPKYYPTNTKSKTLCSKLQRCCQTFTIEQN